MKLKTSIRAGARGCSPEAQYFMQRAIAMENQIARCLTQQAPVVPPVNPPSVGTGWVYPDRSGWCG